MGQPQDNPEIPRPGLFCYVRNRRGVIAGVEPFDGDAGRLHLVHIEYKDDQLPPEEQLVWEVEGASARVLPPTALPDPSRFGPMPAADFDALLRGRALDRRHAFPRPGRLGRSRGCPSQPRSTGVQVEDYQLVPLPKALRMRASICCSPTTWASARPSRPG